MFTREELIAEQFAIDLMKFNNRVHKLFDEAVNINDPVSTSKYMNTLQNEAILSAIANMAQTQFAQVTALVCMFRARANKMPLDTGAVLPDPSYNAEKLDKPNEKAPYAAVVQLYLPKPQERSAMPHGGQNVKDADSSRNAFQSSNDAGSSAPKATSLSCKQKEKGFALLESPSDIIPSQQPLGVVSLLKDGGITEPMTVVTMPDPRKFLVYAPVNILPCLNEAFGRVSKDVSKLGIKFPRLNFSRIDSLANLRNIGSSSEVDDLLVVIKALRTEIYRLEGPETSWRHRRSFAASLRKHEALLYNSYIEKHEYASLTPIKQPRAGRKRTE